MRKPTQVTADHNPAGHSANAQGENPGTNAQKEPQVTAAIVTRSQGGPEQFCIMGSAGQMMYDLFCEWSEYDQWASAIMLPDRIWGR